MQIFVRHAGRRLILSVDPTDRILSVQEQIQAESGIPVDLQRLIIGGVLVDPLETLESQSISEDSTLELFVPADGGKKKKRKKKQFSSKKRVPHKRPKNKLKLLKPFKINKDGSVDFARQTCENCAGAFLANHTGQG
jgi:small subunit ribosomal protein S27Ae